MISGKPTRKDYVAALHQSQVRWRSLPERGHGYPVDKGAGRIDDSLRSYAAYPRPALEMCDPVARIAFQTGAFGTNQDFGTALLRIFRRQHDQAGIFHPAIRIFETGLQPPLEGVAVGSDTQIDALALRQARSAADPIVKGKAKA